MAAENRNRARLNAINRRLFELDPEPSHARHVCSLVLQLFDGLGSLHGLGERERELLETAALLHDIGWSMGARGHHKNALKLILESDLPGYSDSEQLMIANIARYHRKMHPQQDHIHFARLGEAQRRIVTMLAALLRIADGLDRSHSDAVVSITPRIGADGVALALVCRCSCDVELYGFEKKKGLFEQTFGLDIRIERILNQAREAHSGPS